MYPWGHLAVGYLCYSIAVRLRSNRPPEGVAVLALAVGTQLPDLVDKPLSWSFNVLPSGRSLGHSILFATLCGISVWYVGQRYSRRTEAGALFGSHLLHVIADMIPHVITGHWAKLSSLLWPLLPAYQYPGESGRGIISYLFAVDLAKLPTESFVIVVLTIGLWLFDGWPGIDIVVKRIRYLTETDLE